MNSTPLSVLKLSGSQSLNFLSNLIKTGFSCSTLDLSEVSFVTPVICILYEVAKYTKKRIILPNKIDSVDYLSYMRSSSQTPSYSYTRRYIKTFNVRQPEEIIPLVKKFQNLFQDWLAFESNFFIQYAFSELMENVFHHAQSQPGLWIQAQKYPTLGAVEMAIADLGIGIAESMKNNPIYQDIDANTRFVIALNVGTTSKPEEHSGEGLACVLKWIKENREAEAVLISLNNVWYKIDKNIGIYHAPHNIWQGTFLWLKIPKEPDYSLLEIWEKLELKPDLTT